ncbi:hypothetical protein ACH4TV_42825 [Streptomyces sp. NPDC020898]|uniref:hypothetical protein n=1 Tax=Streptomyces sp. NPDC020898 TaxID=3365101 RepID=UPI00379983A2
MLSSAFFSGPHGGGKTTLIDRLLDTSDRYRPPAFEIDFLSEFRSFPALEDWERCLLRLYHRMYIAQSNTEPSEPGTCTLVSRGVRDSEAYIRAYGKLGIIPAEKVRILEHVLAGYRQPCPTVLLNPPLEVVRERLGGRRKAKVRAQRDAVFSFEDTDDFLVALWEAFEDMSSREDVLLLRDNEAEDIARVRQWLAGTAS